MPATERARLRIETVAVRNLRNLEHVDLAFAPRLTVISGANGQGKTALLEAIYFAATSRSFRTSKIAELVRHGAEVASARASFVEGSPSMPDLTREQTAAAKGRRTTVRIDGNAPETLASFATRSPVVVFHPLELALSSGPAAHRRLLLDRLALFRDPSSSLHRARYAHALKARQQILRRPTPPRPGEVEAFETLCARHGAALTKARRAAAEALEPALLEAFSGIAAPGLRLVSRYAKGGDEDEAVAMAALERERPRDAHRPSATFGPHRDDLELRIDDHPARIVASQGQHRALTLALKAAETTTIAASRGVEPILLLDDVSSELDRERTAALFMFLGETRGQIVLTTTRPELIDAPGIEARERLDVAIVGGRVRVP